MSLDNILILAILGGALVLFISERLRSILFDSSSIFLFCEYSKE